MDSTVQNPNITFLAGKGTPSDLVSQSKKLKSHIKVHQEPDLEVPLLFNYYFVDDTAFLDKNLLY